MGHHRLIQGVIARVDEYRSIRQGLGENRAPLLVSGLRLLMLGAITKQTPLASPTTSMDVLNWFVNALSDDGDDDPGLPPGSPPTRLCCFYIKWCY
jgi:hypothetical protein